MTPPADHDQADEIAPPKLAAALGSARWRHLLNARPVDPDHVPADGTDREEHRNGEQR